LVSTDGAALAPVLGAKAASAKVALNRVKRYFEMSCARQFAGKVFRRRRAIRIRPKVGMMILLQCSNQLDRALVRLAAGS
jgi:hypothetical protein